MDEGTELPHVPHPPRHHHLLLDDVSLRKVGPPLPGEKKKQKKKLSESLDPSVDEGHCRRDRWEHAVPPSLTANHPPAAITPHLDVDQQLPQAPGWHHRGGVELGDVALVQSDVVISRETLEQLFMSVDSKV